MSNSSATKFLSFGFTFWFRSNRGRWQLQRKNRADGKHNCAECNRGFAATDRVEDAPWYRSDHDRYRRKRREFRIGVHQFLVAVHSARNDSALRNRIDLLHDEHAESLWIEEERIHVSNDEERK
ncbi:unannotated protein [freshwater metagenome]|uniref:Unannotated protein n=1 Tax=freshwater metagenome TaxID=449393 RepID=A0A6J6MJG4_9ZZZZ